MSTWDWFPLEGRAPGTGFLVYMSTWDWFPWDFFPFPFPDGTGFPFPDAGPLDTFERLFADGFSPRTDAAAIADHAPSSLGIHGLAAALALQRVLAGAS